MNINLTPVNYVPAETGNLNNLGEIVIGSNGKQYYIDKQGRAATWHTTWGDIQIFESFNPPTPQVPGLILRGGDNTRHRINPENKGNLKTKEVN